MALSIFTNVASLNSQRSLGKATMSLGTSFERLSSGLRINSAKDDAAGLAISERMSGKIRGLDQARRNASDGISLVQTVESGLGDISDTLQRLRELAVQSANDSNSASDRTALDNEATQLIASIDQLASSIDFNGRKVLDGSTTSYTFQTGANNSADDRVTVTLQGARASQLGKLARASGTVNATAIAGTGDLTVNGVTVQASSTFGSEVKHSATNDQNSSAYAKAKAINGSNTGAKALAETTALDVTYAAATANYTLTVNDQTIFTTSQASSISDMASRVNAQADKTGVTATVNGGTLELRAADGRNINVTASAAQQGFTTGQTLGQVTLVDDSNIVLDGTAGNGAILLGQAGTPAYTLAVDNNDLNTSVDLTTQAGAREGIDRIDSAIDRVLTLRSRMGAVQNRLEVTSSTLASVSENLNSARSRIRDADFASETARLTRNQILQQAASAMLAQANSSPQQALQLLR